MTSFKLTFHNVSGRRIVEVWDGDDYIAGIYPSHETPRQIHVVSKHPIAVAERDDAAPVNAFNITIGKLP